LKDCGDPRHAKVQPFVSFFSGHVATLVINANHMYLHGHRTMGIFFHIFDVFQILRLLATRGHYSIDIVIGWCMAIYVSNPAGRLGRHFSRGDKTFAELFVPVSGEAAFERLTGVTFIRESRRISTFLTHNPDVKRSFEQAMSSDDYEEEEGNDIASPTARLAYEGLFGAANDTGTSRPNSKKEQ
jgi:hypothetical protein